MEKYNFNAGPSMLPREVIENTAKQMLDFNGCGLSLMEISHRAKYFQPVVDESVALIKELLDTKWIFGYFPWRRRFVAVHADSSQLLAQESSLCEHWNMGKEGRERSKTFW